MLKSEHKQGEIMLPGIGDFEPEIEYDNVFDELYDMMIYSLEELSSLMEDFVDEIEDDKLLESENLNKMRDILESFETRKNKI